jgi:molybdopterin-containing oxidoreductase family iron-sulfur binding subunit
LYEDETSALCQWHIPTKHYLESWGDGRAYDGTITLTQPLILPLYDDRSPYELLAAMLGQSGLDDYDVVREYWANAGLIAGNEFEDFWKEALYNGFIADTDLPAKTVSATLSGLEAGEAAEAPAEGLELVFRPDPSIWDGRFANNGWLQELPKPLTKLTWDNAALMSLATATRLGLDSEDVLELSFAGRQVAAPVWILPGHADEAITVHLGFGRERVGRVGNGVGFNAYALRTSEAFWFGTGLEVNAVDEDYPLASTQNHYVMEGRDLVRAGPLETFREDPAFVHHLGGHEIEEDLSLYPEWEYESYAWGMAVDLNVCTGCNACVVACQAENNIPIVGKEEVRMGREMHWLRIDGYFEGEPEDPVAYHQPMLCQHCEKAPCELVCPVHATVHDSEGLNLMVYNRCIGTRYCSNNCPYKVRRFNFLQYAEQNIEILKAQKNPDVTVRVRGVMEKCTYCIQRISNARITAKKENRPIQDGEVVTACQSACPTQAIVFGDINDPDSQVTSLKAQPHNYRVLAELGVEPRTSYLARLRNPNPELEETGA